MKLFEIYENGDPFSKSWDVSEYQASFQDKTCIYRGDISGVFRKMTLVRYLKRTYPDCKIKVRK